VPPFVIVTCCKTPFSTVTVAAAPEPPPPAKVMVGGSVTGLQMSNTGAFYTLPLATVAVATAVMGVTSVAP
jgi:hypothetical protein